MRAFTASFVAAFMAYPLNAPAQPGSWIDQEKPVSVSYAHYAAVNYGRPLADLVKKAGAADTDDRLTENIFPASGDEIRVREMRLVFYADGRSLFDVHRDLEARGLRAASVKELLAFSIAHPSYRWRYRLVALGSEVIPIGGRIDDALVPMVGATPEPEAEPFIALVRAFDLWTDEIDGPIVVVAVPRSTGKESEAHCGR